MTTATPLRRSTRIRTQPPSYHEDSETRYKVEREVREKREDNDGHHDDDDKNDKNENGENDENEKDNSEEENSVQKEDNDESDSDSDSDSHVETDYHPNDNNNNNNNNKRPSSTARSPQQKGNSTQERKFPTKPKNSKRTTTHRAVQSALAFMAKKVLDESETTTDSLFASLLLCHKALPQDQDDDMATTTTMPSPLKRQSTLLPDSRYTVHLDGIVRRLLKHHSQSNNPLHIQLLNLIFRSIGGSVETNLDPAVHNLEELDDDEWDTVLTNVVQAMRETEPDRTLFFADYNGSAASSSSKQVTLAVVTYRNIFREFWYRLGQIILLGSTSKSYSSSSDKDATPQYSSFRFEVELVRDIVIRLTEVVSVGQPDMRAAATMAVLQLSLACLDRTIELEYKLEVATRQHSAASKANSNRKVQALRLSVDAWKRFKMELEELVEETILQAVFMHRYRDSNPHIRCLCLDALSKMTLMRPDLFLQDKYLKYLGWMCSDKDAQVRLVSLKGLLAPFRHVHPTMPSSSSSSLSDKPLSNLPEALELDLSLMQNVCLKFLSRFVDCTNDSQSIQVQEIAMELLLAMLKDGFLDDWDDDDGWDQVNLKALDKTTSPKVRKDALYFILDQLDSFDGCGDEEESKNESVGEKKRMERLEGISSWIANKLCDGAIPIDKIRINLTDYVVQSLRDMPEHKSLATDWSVMLKAIRSDSNRQALRGREAVAKQRVLLRMLACAAQLEVGSIGDKQVMTEGQDLAGIRKNSRSRKSAKSNIGILSEALLKSLPNILQTFKGDVLALRSLTKLPRYVTAEVFSLPTHRNNFHALIKSLCAIYLDSTDEMVLQDSVISLTILAEGDHARVPQVRMQMKQLSASLQERLMELFRGSDPQVEQRRSSPRRKRRSVARRSETSESTISSIGMASEITSSAADVEHSIYLALVRWRILVQRCSVSILFDDHDLKDEGVDGFCNTVSEAIAKRLQDRQVILPSSESSGSVTVPKIWMTEDPHVHRVLAKSVKQALLVLLCITAWKLHEALQKSKTDNDSHSDSSSVQNQSSPSDDDSIDVDDLVVLRMRDRLVKLLVVCFDQFLEDQEDVAFSEEQREFASEVQISAGQVASDLRVLFPREWSQAADPVRRALALTNDSQLIGGFARYLQSREQDLRACAKGKDKKNEVILVNDLLMPIVKSVTANWEDGNRREAALALAHITGSGRESSETVNAMARMLKQVNSVRFLEAQMISLRLSFEHWLNSEPEEPESDRPTEEEMDAYEKAEIKHGQLFQSIEQQASRLFVCLGARRHGDKQISRALLGFLQEGIRFAFHGDKVVEDDLVLGSRLPFLLILPKYANSLKRDKERVQILKEILDREEADLRSHPEFDEVHEDDLAALASFREALGIKKSLVSTPLARAESPSSQSNYTGAADSLARTPASGGVSLDGSRRKTLTASSQKSIRSAMSSLSPLYEEDATMREDDSDETGSPSPQKRRRLTTQYRGRDSIGSGSIMSTLEGTQNRIDEEEDFGSHSSGMEED